MKPMWIVLRWLPFLTLFAVAGAVFTTDIPPWFGALIGVAVGTFVLWFGFEPETPNGKDTKDGPGPEDP